MTEQLIDPADYTPEIQACVSRLKHRMDVMLTGYEDGDVRAFQVGDEVYVLANPVLGEEPVYDEFGQVKELVPMRNLTLIYPQDRLSLEGGMLKVKLGRVRILRPELCMKIVGGEIGDGGNLPHPQVGARETQSEG